MGVAMQGVTSSGDVCGTLGLYPVIGGLVVDVTIPPAGGDHFTAPTLFFGQVTNGAVAAFGDMQSFAASIASG